MTRSRPAQQIQYVTHNDQVGHQQQTNGQRFVNSIAAEPIRANNSNPPEQIRSNINESPSIQRVYASAPVCNSDQIRGNQQFGQDPRNLSTHDYLRQTVAQVLHEGLNILAKVTCSVILKGIQATKVFRSALQTRPKHANFLETTLLRIKTIN